MPWRRDTAPDSPPKIVHLLGLKKKQSTWTPGKPGRPPAWAAEYVQKQKEEKKEEKKKKPTTEADKPKTKWQQPGDRGRPPLWAKEYDWY